jgi:hypothetical protein
LNIFRNSTTDFDEQNKQTNHHRWNKNNYIITLSKDFTARTLTYNARTINKIMNEIRCLYGTNKQIMNETRWL